jgi:uncharacterized protein DUF5916/cellulose/xylan binding protein with CBM9 domain
MTQVALGGARCVALLSIVLCATARADDGSGADATPAPDAAKAAGISAPSLLAVRTDHPPDIDGKIDEDVWQKAPPQTSFTQNFPDERQAPTERTELRVLYDDAAVYVAVRCFDAHPEQIVARLTRRDRDIESDKVTVDISSKNDRRTAYHFEINAAGRQLDGTRSNDTDFSTDWDGIWYSAVTRDNQGWTAELAIPLIALRYSGDTTSFGFQVRRYLQRRQEIDEWAYVPRSSQGEVSYYGKLDALTGLHAKRLLQIAPYDSRSVTVRRKQPPLNGTDTGGNFGADVKLGLTSALTLDATINPDFGTVEVDQVVLNLSTVETYFPEKRPFFVEGADLFSTPFQLFYSRRIGKSPEDPTLADGVNVVAAPPVGQILGAVKLTGLVTERLSIGVLDAVTASQDTVINRGQGGRDEKLLVDPLANFGVLRLQRRLGESSSIGVLGTSVNRFEQANQETPVSGDACPIPHFGIQAIGAPVAGRCTNDAYTGGADLRLRTADQAFGASGQVIGSLLDKGPDRINPDGTTIKPGELGWGVMAEAGKYGGEHLLFRLSYSYMTPTLEINDAGFNGAANDQLLNWMVTLRSTTPLLGFRDVALTLGGVYETIPLTGAPNGRFGYINWAATLPNFWTLSAHLIPYYLPYYNNREPRDGAQLETGPAYLYSGTLKTDTSKPVIFALSGFLEKTRRGYASTGNVTVNIRPASNVELDVISNGSWSYGDPRWLSTTPATGGSRDYLFRDLDSRSWDVLLRGTWTFSPTLSLQLYAQLFLDAGHYGKTTTINASGPYPRLDNKNFLSVTDPAGTDNDFRDSALNVNAFFRWEFRPGSALWLVYTRNQLNTAYDVMEGQGRLRFDRLDGPSTDVFLVKLSYLWEPLRS